MTIKNIRGWFAMFSITLLIVFVFTACSDDEEDPYIPPPIVNPTPLAVGSMKAGAVSETSIRIQWEHSPSRDSSWFEEYHVEVIPPPPLVSWFDTVSKSSNAVTFTGLSNATVYIFKVTAVSDSGKVSPAKEIEWAASKHFNTTSGNPIRVYGAASSFGSGLRLFNGTEPEVFNVAQGANWHLGLLARNDTLWFGSASVIGPKFNSWTNPTLTPVYIGDVYYDESTLGLTGDNYYQALNTMTFTAKHIDLKESSIAAKSQGLVFFVRVGSNHATANYAKVIVRKSGGAYLQGTSPNQYIEVVVSYQTAAGVPYAKIFAGK